LVIVEKPVVVEGREKGGVTSHWSVFMEERDLSIRVEEVRHLRRGERERERQR
jgi:hypothetical protein